MKFKLLLLLLSVVYTADAQLPAMQGKYTHSHNDYNNSIPFYRAFQDGFNSIEADVYYVNGRLLVSHDEKAIRPERSLKGLYIDPIRYALFKDTTRQLCLLIDVKDDYRKTLPALVKELQPLKKYLPTKNNPGRLKILISGNRPLPAAYKNYASFLFFDDDLKYPHTKTQWDRVGQVSLNFENYSKWKGEGPIPDADRQRLLHTTDSVHTNTGKLVRFWGAPDMPASWSVLIDGGADIISTDMIDELAAFLTQKQILQPANKAIK